MSITVTYRLFPATIAGPNHNRAPARKKEARHGNPEHLKTLLQGLATWNQRRKDHRNVEPNLGQADLSEANLNDADFSTADLKGVSAGAVARESAGAATRLTRGGRKGPKSLLAPGCRFRQKRCPLSTGRGYDVPAKL
jgi:hypothetical protein